MFEEMERMMTIKQNFRELVRALFNDEVELIREDGEVQAVAYLGITKESGQEAVGLLEKNDDGLATVRFTFEDDVDVDHLIDVAEGLTVVESDSVGELLTMVDELFGDQVDVERAREQIDERLERV